MGEGGGVGGEAERMDQREPTRAARVGRRDLTGDHCTEGVADQRRALESKRVQKLVVTEHEVPQPIELVGIVRRVRTRAGMLGRMDGEVTGELVEEWIPRETPGAVEEDERGAAALGENSDPNLVAPDRDRVRARASVVKLSFGGRHASPPAATPATTGDTVARRKRSGHQ